MSDFWDNRYREARQARGTVWSLEPNVWVAASLGTLEPGTAVDLAAGEGRTALWLASLGWRVTAVDFSGVGLETGRERADELGVDVAWVLADARDWIAPEPVDLVAIVYLQLPAADFARAVSNAIASLAPGGTLAVIGHDRTNLENGVGGPQDPSLLLDLERLASLAIGLEILQCRRIERLTTAGTAIDVVLLARKPEAAS